MRVLLVSCHPRSDSYTGYLAARARNGLERGSHEVTHLDLYAAGFLHGYTHGRALDDCARLGSLAASHVIQHIGPRPQHSLDDLRRNEGL